jgi:hypothetical protein
LSRNEAHAVGSRLAGARWVRAGPVPTVREHLRDSNAYDAANDAGLGIDHVERRSTLSSAHAPLTYVQDKMRGPRHPDPVVTVPYDRATATPVTRHTKPVSHRSRGMAINAKGRANAELAQAWREPEGIGNRRGSPASPSGSVATGCTRRPRRSCRPVPPDGRDPAARPGRTTWRLHRPLACARRWRIGDVRRPSGG